MMVFAFPESVPIHLKFLLQIVEDIYVKELVSTKFSTRRIIMLEFRYVYEYSLLLGPFVQSIVSLTSSLSVLQL